MAPPLTPRERLDREIGTRCRRARLALRMTQQQVADALGYESGTSVYKHEVGETSVRASDLILLAGLLRVPPSSLMPDAPGQSFGTLETRLMRAWKAIPDEGAARLLVEMAERLSIPREPTHQRGRADAPTNPAAPATNEPPALLAMMERLPA